MIPYNTLRTTWALPANYPVIVKKNGKRLFGRHIESFENRVLVATKVLCFTFHTWYDEMYVQPMLGPKVLQ